MCQDKSAIKQSFNITRALLLALPLCGFYSHRFVVDERIESFITLISILATIWVYYIHVLAYKKKIWVPINNISATLRTIVGFLLSPIVFVLAWISFGILIPAVYTYCLGNEEPSRIQLIKDARYSDLTCKYKMKISNYSLPRSSFKFCISEDEYNLLPSNAEYYEANVLASPLGYIVEGIKFE